MNLTAEQRSILTLALVPGMLPRRFAALVNRFGSADAALGAPASGLAGTEDISPGLARTVASARKTVDVDKELERARACGAIILTCCDPGYPESLKSLPDYPPVLYVRGSADVLHTLSVALVGTRTATAYGRNVAARLSSDLAQAGITTVSGLARGIDTEVHQATLSAGGKTVAVLGNGFGNHYPAENRKLEDRIASCGALVSEFAVETIPDRCNFPRRNRIISGLTLATVVVEADIKSGALVTASCAAEQGKDVFAVPGPVTSRYSRGPHYLVKSGAHLIESVDDIVEAIRPLAEWWQQKRPVREKTGQETEQLNEQESAIVHLLDQHAEGVSIEYLAAHSALPSGQLASSLLMLELKGRVRSLPGKMYIKTA